MNFDDFDEIGVSDKWGMPENIAIWMVEMIWHDDPWDLGVPYSEKTNLYF